MRIKYLHFSFKYFKNLLTQFCFVPKSICKLKLTKLQKLIQYFNLPQQLIPPKVQDEKKTYLSSRTLVTFPDGNIRRT